MATSDRFLSNRHRELDVDNCVSDGLQLLHTGQSEIALQKVTELSGSIGSKYPKLERFNQILTADVQRRDVFSQLRRLFARARSLTPMGFKVASYATVGILLWFLTVATANLARPKMTAFREIGRATVSNATSVFETPDLKTRVGEIERGKDLAILGIQLPVEDPSLPILVRSNTNAHLQGYLALGTLDHVLTKDDHFNLWHAFLRYDSSAELNDMVARLADIKVMISAIPSQDFDWKDRSLLKLSQGYLRLARSTQNDQTAAIARLDEADNFFKETRPTFQFSVEGTVQRNQIDLLRTALQPPVPIPTEPPGKGKVIPVQASGNDNGSRFLALSKDLSAAKEKFEANPDNRANRDLAKSVAKRVIDELGTQRDAGAIVGAARELQKNVDAAENRGISIRQPQVNSTKAGGQ